MSFRIPLRASRRLPLLFLAAWMLLLLLYGPAREAMLIDDGVNGLYDLKHQGWHGLLNAYQFDSLYQGYYLLLHLAYSLFGMHATGWFLFFSAMHAFNTVCLYQLCKNLLELYKAEHTSGIARVAAILFLCCPLLEENIIWAATTHYDAGLLLLLLSFLWLHRYLTVGVSRKSYVLFLVWNAFAMLTFELNLLAPLLYLGYFLLYVRLPVCHIHWKKCTVQILLPVSMLLLGYLLAMYLTRGTLHVHEGKGSSWLPGLTAICSNLSRHLLRAVLLLNYWPLSWRDRLFALCGEARYYVPLLSCIPLLVVYVYRRHKKMVPVFLLFLCMGLLFFIPFTRGFFTVVFKYENLRYNYFAATFLLPAGSILLFTLNSRWRTLLFWCWLSVYLLALLQTVHDKRQSARLYHRFIQHCPDPGKGKIILLNTPSFANESYMFWDRSRLPIALNCYRELNAEGHLTQVLFYNGISDADSFRVQQVNDSSWHMQLLTPGSWLMNTYQGASSYEDTLYRCEVGEWGDFYLRLKRPLQPDESLYYFDSYTFHRLR